MKWLFDIAELEADIFSEDELQAIETYVEEERDGEEAGLSDEQTTAVSGEAERETENQEDGDFPALELELTLEDGEQLTCEVVGVFLEGEKEYMALHPKGNEEDLVHLMILEQGEDDSICLLPIEDEAEMEKAALAFHRFMDDSALEFEERVDFLVENGEE